MTDNKPLGITKTAENAQELLDNMAGLSLECPKCEVALFSVFDKLHIRAYGSCYTCVKDEKTGKRQSDNIFAIINAL
jgi:uncharacterized protein (DUF983 family)